MGDKTELPKLKRSWIFDVQKEIGLTFCDINWPCEFLKDARTHRILGDPAKGGGDLLFWLSVMPKQSWAFFRLYCG